ncbi:MAG: lipid A deacylase LpxR family protein [Burkholderiaceae bacterium]
MKPFNCLSIFTFALATAGASASAYAENLLDDARDAWRNGKMSHVLDIDNDSLKLNRDDGLYTSGLRYTQRYSLASPQGLNVFGWRIGQELYTASDINLPPELVGPRDHPYAAWLYGGVVKEEHDLDGRRIVAGIDFGCLGPCAGGEATQDFLHGILNQPRPKGWDKQVRNEAGIVLYGDFTPRRWPLGKHADIAPTIHGRFGNIFTDAGLDVRVRFGQLNLLPDQRTLHGFVRMGGRAVAYNASLEGGYFSDSDPHTVKPKRFVAEAEAGIVWNSAPFGILLSIVHRDNEVRGLSDSVGEQDFVRLSVSYTP